MRVLVTGCGGQVGAALLQVLEDPVGVDRTVLDVADPASVAAYDWSGVEAIVNAAAFTQVDRAEEAEWVHAAWQANATGVLHLARVARERDLPLVHLSTDYVFDGTAARPLPVDAPLRPLGVYGASKAAGEHAARLAPRHHVVRTAWVFGAGASFPRTMLRLAASRAEVTVVDDQLGRPTYAPHLAESLAQHVRGGAPYGTYHVTGTGPVVSWAELAREVFAVAGVDCRVRPVSTAEYAASRPGLAPRPAYSVLDTASAERAGLPLRPWREGLRAFVELERGAS